MTKAELDERQRQPGFHEKCSADFATYNGILGYYKVQSCLEHARGTRLLDIGCGDGSLTQMMSVRFDKVVGVDVSGERIARARQLLPTAEFHECLVEDFDTNLKFDTITMLNILEHVADPELVLRQLGGLLSDDGVLIVHVPNAEAINRKIAVLMGTLTHLEELSPFDIHVAGHRRSYTTDTLVDEIRTAGLNVIATGGVFYKMLSAAQMDWFLANGPWNEGGFGWGRVGAEPRDWRAEFCRACYEIGKQYPRECNIVYAVATK